MKSFNYENDQYLKSLDKLGDSYYFAYVNIIKRMLKNKKFKFLDVGSGSGTVLNLLKKEGFKNGFGIEISRLFVKSAKENGVKNVFYYDGKKFPFKDNSFKLVGSFNVLEHVEDSSEFLKEQLRVLEKNGYLIIICPNFISSMLFNNWHPRLKGGVRKFKNLLEVIKKMSRNYPSFEKIKPIKTKVFKYDSDAITVTNLMDIKRTLGNKNCTVVYESGFINYSNSFVKFINKIPLLRYMSPSCVLVMRKK